MCRRRLPPYHLQMTYSNFVGGKWVPSESGATFENRNPARTSDLVGTFPDSTTADAEQAIAAARQAFDSWRLVPAPKRAEILFRAAQIIASRKEAFARDMTREMGKVLEETRGDVQEAIDMTYFLAAEGRRLHGQTLSQRKCSGATRDYLGASGRNTADRGEHHADIHTHLATCGSR